MPPRRTPNPRAAAAADLEDVLVEVFDKLAADDPAWFAQLSAAVKAALDRSRTRGQGRRS